MNQKTKKTKGDKSQTLSKHLSPAESRGSATFQFKDNRQEAIAQRKLQEVMQNSPRTKQLFPKSIEQRKKASKQLTPIQRIDNMGAGMTSEDQNRELFVQSNDKPQFRYELPAKMTYHHVIPRNKLATFWNKVQANGHLAELTNAIDQLVDGAIKRIKETPDLDNNSAILEVQGNEQNKGQIMAIMKKLGKGDQLTALEVEGAGIIEKIYQWWPANIHHGPNDRPQSNPEEDDGGNNFEESAKYVLKANQFNNLKKLDGLMDQYQKSGDKKILKNIRGLIIQLGSIGAVTPYNEKKWYQVKSGTLIGKWRINSKA